MDTVKGMGCLSYSFVLLISESLNHLRPSGCGCHQGPHPTLESCTWGFWICFDNTCAIYTKIFTIYNHLHRQKAIGTAQWFPMNAVVWNYHSSCIFGRNAICFEYYWDSPALVHPLSRWGKRPGIKISKAQRTGLLDTSFEKPTHGWAHSLIFTECGLHFLYPCLYIKNALETSDFPASCESSGSCFRVFMCSCMRVC